MCVFEFESEKRGFMGRVEGRKGKWYNYITISKPEKL